MGCETGIEVYTGYDIRMWTVEFLNDAVLAELDALPADQIARFIRIGELIQTLGLERVGGPHVKYLEKGVWEIRLQGRDGISRALYVAAKARRVVVVRVFTKKTRTTPRHEIQLALQRAEDVR
jgi:phage-related protein